MTPTSTDRIEKSVFLRAPRARVWRALTDPREFGRWFGVRIDTPFTAGARVRGAITHPGYEHLTFEIVVGEVEPERRLTWHWHPYPIDPETSYDEEPTTLVVFTLDEVSGGTRLHVVESGFDALPPARRLDAFRGNEQGWIEQMVNIERHVSATE